MTVKNPSYHMIARIFYSFIHRVSGRCFYSPRAEPKRLLSGVLSAVKSDLLCVPITMAIIASEFGYDLAKITAVLNHAKLVETAGYVQGAVGSLKGMLEGFEGMVLRSFEVPPFSNLD
ncbi:hypothetical protein N9I87_00085 [Gammaproteobacteria bacterium]|jgi:hypothetical protein|nr:hypothetical protein [Gammaproteobacteria bacterium]MDP5004057.1 hypothetical protein [OM182 bacterium]MDA8795692.1 hypothetical protein [Gammaproteobacteria bacterium]MDA8927610.1 hypothetical protein [Gammaproteobacteria bacterium]MDB4136814.1 hypothetical protein [Gammaproteobacteria bacterium]